MGLIAPGQGASFWIRDGTGVSALAWGFFPLSRKGSPPFSVFFFYFYMNSLFSSVEEKAFTMLCCF